MFFFFHSTLIYKSVVRVRYFIFVLQVLISVLRMYLDLYTHLSILCRYWVQVPTTNYLYLDHLDTSIKYEYIWSYGWKAVD